MTEDQLKAMEQSAPLLVAEFRRVSKMYVEASMGEEEANLKLQDTVLDLARVSNRLADLEHKHDELVQAIAKVISAGMGGG